MSKAYVQARPDLANLAALNAAQVAAPSTYVKASLVMTNDGKLHVCVDPAHATTPFQQVGTQA